jgi:hypothetical protein
MSEFDFTNPDIHETLGYLKGAADGIRYAQKVGGTNCWFSASDRLPPEDPNLQASKDVLILVKDMLDPDAPLVMYTAYLDNGTWWVYGYHTSDRVGEANWSHEQVVYWTPAPTLPTVESVAAASTGKDLHTTSEDAKGCDFCEDVPSRYRGIRAEGFYQVAADDVYNPELEVNYCPVCGRKLRSRDIE